MPRHLALIPPQELQRPRTRGDCSPCATCQKWRDDFGNQPCGAALQASFHLACGHGFEEAIRHSRPCVFVSCRSALYLEVNPDTGSLKINSPEIEPWEMRETCSLDVAERGGITLEEIGAILGLTRERIRQVEVRGLVKMRVRAAMTQRDD